MNFFTVKSIYITKKECENLLQKWMGTLKPERLKFFN